MECESAVYFACLEALQNVAKHAPAASVVLALDVVDDDLVFTVTDDGPGFDSDGQDGGGSGLLGLRDRIAAVGGALTVHSSPGAGVVVRGVTPVSR